MQVIERHFWMKREEIEQQVEEWIADMEQGSTDKRTGRTIAHSTVALKVCKIRFCCSLGTRFLWLETSLSEKKTLCFCSGWVYPLSHNSNLEALFPLNRGTTIS